MHRNGSTAASQVIVEINLNRPLALEGLHDVYQRGDDPIPIVGNGNPLKRIGVPYFPVDPEKIKAIVISDLGDKPSKEAKPDAMGAADRPVPRRLLQKGDRRRPAQRILCRPSNWDSGNCSGA